MRVLVLNAGSSSLKWSVLDAGQRRALAAGSTGWGSDASRQAGRAGSVEAVIAGLGNQDIAERSIRAVGHRFVHGGDAFRRPTLIGPEVLEELAVLTDLAPLHNGVALETIRAAREALPDPAHVAVFDTGFHADLPAQAYIYPLPWSWYEQWNIRRYGFHGLSLTWAVRRAGELLDRSPAELGLVVAHLGSGCSVTAIQATRSRSTSMGMTPLEGLMMGSRAGSVDPGILLDVLRRGRLDVDGLGEALDHQSGLLGVSGISGDVREVSRAAQAGNPRAVLALDIFVGRAAEAIAAAATSLDRFDALVFTGGIGENAAAPRSRIVERLAVLGVPPIEQAESGQDRLLSAGEPPHVLRVEAREDVVIAEAVAELLTQRPS